MRKSVYEFKYLFILLIVCSLTSCGGYYKLLKSDDFEAKWDKANEYYEQRKFNRVIELMEELKAVYKGTERAEQAVYMLANAYYYTKDYYSASAQYQIYYKISQKNICRGLSLYVRKAPISIPPIRACLRKAPNGHGRGEPLFGYFPTANA